MIELLGICIVLLLCLILGIFCVIGNIKDDIKRLARVNGEISDSNRSLAFGKTFLYSRNCPYRGMLVHYIVKDGFNASGVYVMKEREVSLEEFNALKEGLEVRNT